MKDKAVDYSAFSPVDLLRGEIRVERQEKIPVELIVQENALIDPQHAQNLAESMMGVRKQISPVTVRARLLEDGGGMVVYDVIDGFHRSAGKRIIEELTQEPQEMDTIVLYACDDEELYDLRVLAASSVKSIKFARMAEWMKRSFLSTKWQNQRLHGLVEAEELTLSQVFNLAQFDASGERIGLEANEAIELKDWALRKSKQWGKQISTLMTEMRTVELAAPDLVQRVRTGGGGKGGRGVLTRTRLEAIVTHLPGDWEAQRLLADLAIAKNILADDLDFLAWTYAEAKEAGDDPTLRKIMEQPQVLLNPQAPKNEDDSQKNPPKKNQKIDTLMERYQLTKRTRSPHARSASEKALGPIDQRVLEKHHVPEVINALMDIVRGGLVRDLSIISLTNGDITLSLNPPTIRLNNDKTIILAEREAELMVIFNLLEGLTISNVLLSMIGHTEEMKSTRESVESLKDKLSQLSVKASKELWIGKKDGYSWLAEQ